MTVDRIHTFGTYDLEIDTTAGITPALESVLAAWRNRPPKCALAAG